MNHKNELNGYLIQFTGCFMMYYDTHDNSLVKTNKRYLSGRSFHSTKLIYGPSKRESMAHSVNTTLTGH